MDKRTEENIKTLFGQGWSKEEISCAYKIDETSIDTVIQTTDHLQEKTLFKRPEMIQREKVMIAAKLSSRGGWHNEKLLEALNLTKKEKHEVALILKNDKIKNCWVSKDEQTIYILTLQYKKLDIKILNRNFNNSISIDVIGPYPYKIRCAKIKIYVNREKLTFGYKKDRDILYITDCGGMFREFIRFEGHVSILEKVLLTSPNLVR
ncbi:hypothetical protein FACS189447_02500 [Spirochaetia bacterium]|nr:hypothetical protein FACS189447_02500 [Spirochaetia bacterium]